jgi:hypothetical protein
MKIKAQDEQKTEKVTVSFPEDVYRDLVAYRDLLGGKTKLNYVIVEAVRGFLAADRSFHSARARAPQLAAEVATPTTTRTRSMDRTGAGEGGR